MANDAFVKVEKTKDYKLSKEDGVGWDTYGHLDVDHDGLVSFDEFVEGKICANSALAVDCPDGGCYGFSVTLPEDFLDGLTGDPRPEAESFSSDENFNWNVEWKKNIADAALSRVKAQVSPKQYQIFDCYVVKQWEAKKVQEKLNVSMAQVYLAKHRVGAVLKRELAKLEDVDDVG